MRLIELNYRAAGSKFLNKASVITNVDHIVTIVPDDGFCWLSFSGDPELYRTDITTHQLLQVIEHSMDSSPMIIAYWDNDKPARKFISEYKK